AGHGVNGIGEVLPRSSDAGDDCLPTEFSIRSHLSSDARHLGREDTQLLNHRVHDVRRTQEFAFQCSTVHVEAHCLSQISLSDGADRASDFCCRSKEILNEGIDGDLHLPPGTALLLEARALSGSSFFADHLADSLQLVCHLLVGRNDFVEGIGNFPLKACPRAGKSNRKVAVAHSTKRGQYQSQVQSLGWGDAGSGVAVILQRSWSGRRGLLTTSPHSSKSPGKRCGSRMITALT